MLCIQFRCGGGDTKLAWSSLSKVSGIRRVCIIHRYQFPWNAPRWTDCKKARKPPPQSPLFASNVSPITNFVFIFTFMSESDLLRKGMRTALTASISRAPIKKLSAQAEYDALFHELAMMAAVFSWVHDDDHGDDSDVYLLRFFFLHICLCRYILWVLIIIGRTILTIG